MSGDQTLIVLIHREQIVVIARPLGGVNLQFINHRHGGDFLIHLTQLVARFTEEE